MTKDNESQQYRFDALNTAIQNNVKLKNASDFFGENSKHYKPAVYNTIAGLLYQAITDSDKLVLQCAEFYCTKTNEDIKDGIGQTCFHKE